MTDNGDGRDESVDELIARDFGPQPSGSDDAETADDAPVGGVVTGDKHSGDAFAEHEGWADRLQDDVIAADFGADPDED